MKLLFANNAVSALANSITAAATTLAVQAGHGARFPQPAAGEGFYLTLFQVIAGIESNYEVVLVTARSVDTLTITRAQEGTAARAFVAGDSISHRPTAQTMRSFAQPDEVVAFAKAVSFAVGPTVPTAAAGTNTTQVATTQFATTAIAKAVADLVASSPAALDTLKELSDALGGDASFAATMSTSLGNRLRVDAAQALTTAQQTQAKDNLALVKADVGLDSVDNTSDVDKPVSTAQQTALNLKANLASPALTGTPTAPTPSAGDNDTSVATTAFVQVAANGMLTKSVAGGVQVTLTAVEAGYAIIKLTGALTAHINVVVPAAAARWTIWNATTGAFNVTVKTSAGTGILVTQGTTWQLLCDGTNVVDASSDFKDIALSGNPTAPTPTAGDNDTSIATTAFVQTAIAPKAPLASPALTGTPTAPTPAVGDNDTQIATTAFVNVATNGMLTKSVAGAVTVALTAAEASYPVIKLTGAITANIAVTVPAATNRVIIWNATTGAFSVTIKTPAGTGIVVAQGKTSNLFCDGVNVLDANNDTTDMALTGVPTAPTAAQTANSTQIATTAYVRTAVSDLVSSSPAALDTLNELSAALGNDENFAATTATSLGNRLRVDTAAQGLTTTQQTNAKTNLALQNVTNTSDANKPVSTAQQTALNLKLDASKRDATGGVAGLTAWAINLYNSVGTVKNTLTSYVLAARTWVMPDKDGTVAMISDIMGRNRIINGAMMVDQRNNGASLSAPAGLSYVCDRWNVANSRGNNGTLTAQRTAAGSAARPYWLVATNGVTAAAPAATDNVGINQFLEGFSIASWMWGTSSAKPVTLSFWVMASAAGTYAFSLRNAAVTRCYVGHFTVAQANVEQYITVTIPPETTGVWQTDNQVGIFFGFDLGVGSTYTTATIGSWISNSNKFGSTTSVKLTATANASFRITEVQLEAGDTATDFEFQQYAAVLAMCQRYYQIISDGDLPAAAFNSGDVMCPIRFPIEMRAAPTASAAAWGGLVGNGGSGQCAGGTFSLIGKRGASLDLTSFTGITPVTGISYVVRQPVYQFNSEF